MKNPFQILGVELASNYKLIISGKFESWIVVDVRKAERIDVQLHPVGGGSVALFV